MTDLDLQIKLAKLADRLEAKKHSYLLAHSGLAAHVFQTIADEIRAVIKEEQSVKGEQ